MLRGCVRRLGQIVEIVHHEAGALSETLLAGVSHPVEAFEGSPVAEVKAGHGIERLSGSVLRVEKVADARARKRVTQHPRCRPKPVRAIDVREIERASVPAAHVQSPDRSIQSRRP
jgi:hypothetical protein